MTRNKLFLTVLAVALVLPLWAATSADAQGPRIDRLEIMVLDMGRQGDRVGTVLPGQTFDMNRGETLRFRMVAVPNGSGERYPSTRFWVDSGKSRVKTEAANVEVGNITITAQNGNNSRERTRVSYEIVDRGHNIPRNLRTGSFFINVDNNGNFNRAGRAGQANDDRYDRRNPNRRDVNPGLTLYEHRDYTGRRAMIDGSVADVRSANFPVATASSVRVQPGCTATLYEGTNYRGRSVTLNGDENNLRDTRLGDDSVGSVRLDCNGAAQGDDRFATNGNGRIPNPRPGSGRGSVTIYEHQDFRGDHETFWSGRLADLDGTAVGVNRASSVRIQGNCRVTLYEDTNFEGRVSVLTRDVTDLSRVRVGNDTLSSIIVECN